MAYGISVRTSAGDVPVEDLISILYIGVVDVSDPSVGWLACPADYNNATDIFVAVPLGIGYVNYLTYNANTHRLTWAYNSSVPKFRVMFFKSNGV